MRVLLFTVLNLISLQVSANANVSILDVINANTNVTEGKIENGLPHESCNLNIEKLDPSDPYYAVTASVYTYRSIGGQYSITSDNFDWWHISLSSNQIGGEIGWKDKITITYNPITLKIETYELTSESSKVVCYLL